MAQISKFEVAKDGTVTPFIKSGRVWQPEIVALNRSLAYDAKARTITVHTVHAHDIALGTWHLTADKTDPASYYELEDTHFTTRGGKTLMQEALSGMTVTGSIHADHIQGSAGDDHLYGYDNDDQISGEGGDDHIDGGSGNDVIHGGDGCDVLTGNTGDDVLWGDAGDDIVQGNEGNDALDGGDGNDRLEGGTGDDVLHGGDGNDSLIADTGNDVLDGGNGNDLLDCGTGDDVLHGDAGNDILIADTGNDVLDGGSGNDKLDGGTGDDVLDGGAGNDRLDGGPGVDVLIGGPGADVMTGGAHMDRFVFRQGDLGGTTFDTADRITDFSHMDGDRIDLSQVDANAVRSGLQHFTFIGTAAFGHVAGELHVARQGGATVLQGDTDGDGRPDFAIFITNHLDAPLDDGDLIL